MKVPKEELFAILSQFNLVERRKNPGSIDMVSTDLL